jgi:tetratricopeptide (TPR) repeat protein
MRYRLIALLAACSLAGPAAAQQPGQQPPWKPKNLKFFPQDITRPVLVQRMREFSFALSVRCQYCHAGGDGVSFEGVDFASDEKPAKVKARAMLQMLAEINGSLLTKIPSRAEPRVEVTCATCHRGLPLPKSLQTTLLEIIEKDGLDAAIKRYKSLRADTTSGAYNFDQWETMELARRLQEAKNIPAAIGILELTGEFYPKSPAPDFQIGELLLERGDRDGALARYRKAVEKAPDHQGAKARIAELEKK